MTDTIDPTRAGTAADPAEWTLDDATSTYHVEAWSAGYFSVNARGNVDVTPAGPDGPAIDLHDLVVDLQRRGYNLPVQLRFSEILEDRLRSLNEAFCRAIEEYGYGNRYRAIYPIKVNQQCDILEELLEFGRSWQMGLEAGSKAELLVALAYMDQPDGMIVCNGFKDEVYIETALLAQELGRHPILVIDRFVELEMILKISVKLGLRPHIGVRARLAARGVGRWNETAGVKSKFGLSASELVILVARLEEAGMLDCLELLHFHIGSQVTEIRAIKNAMRESARFFVELYRMGATPRYLDVGGGLGVDYDGSKSRSSSSINYTMQEYANDVVDAVLEVCKGAGVPHPQIFSESGRALSAHHSVLVFDVLGANQITMAHPPACSEGSAVPTIRALYETWEGMTQENFRERYHDGLQLKEEAANLFDLGYLTLKGRSEAEDLFWAICLRVRQYAKDLEFPLPEFDGLERILADTYYCNFSLFQSVPDSWAVDQLFPVMPIHRLDECPTRLGTLADLTCDSDGKVNHFINRGEDKDTLELHPINGRPYYIGMFLVGAYQETLGDLHNLFGDTTAVHVTLDGEHGYRIDNVVAGDTVKEVLEFVQYERRALLRRVRKASEEAVRSGGLDLERSARLLRRFEEGLSGYTYLARENVQVQVPLQLSDESPSELDLDDDDDSDDNDDNDDNDELDAEATGSAL